MIRFRHILFLILILPGACVEVPDFSSTPFISYNSVVFKDESPIDYIYLTINFKDGDGDLGLSNSDILSSPFTEFIDSAGVQVSNPNHYNIYPFLFRKNGDKYDSVLVSYRGIFPRLRDDGRKGPIEGTIEYKLGSFNFFGEDNSIAKIKVYIKDRKLNKSNVIETPPFPVNYE